MQVHISEALCLEKFVWSALKKTESDETEAKEIMWRTLSSYVVDVNFVSEWAKYGEFEEKYQEYYPNKTVNQLIAKSYRRFLNEFEKCSSNASI